MQRLELTGQRFGRWTVLRFAGIRNGNSRWLCRCACGRRKVLGGRFLTHHYPRSCGCLFRELSSTRRRVHGMTGSPEFRSWAAMLTRCSNRKSKDWRLYGARGIRVCERWRRSFLAFHSDMGKRPRGRTLDRRNNDGNYTPQNCRWATPLTQSRNRRICRR